MDGSSFPDDESFQDLLVERIEQLAEDIDEEDDLSDAIGDLFDDLAVGYYEELLSLRDSILEEWRMEISGFKERLYDAWQEPIDLFEAYLVFVQEIGQLYSDLRQEESMDDDDLVHLALIHLHGRACLIAREILTLVKNGFADAAHARWRSIHEVAVVAEFIRQTGQETAKRFLLHQTIDDYHQGLAYREYQDSLEVEPLSDEQFAQIESLRADLLDEFGRGFDGQWGWAAHELDSGKFTEMEEKAGYGHHRPYYVYASKANIHSGSKGTFEQLATTSDYQRNTVAAPSNIGFSLPATHTARSLFQATTSLVLHRPNEEFLVHLLVAELFLEDIEEAFPKVRAEIKQREEEMWDEYLDDLLEEIEEDIDEYVEDLEDFTPPIVEIDTDDFDVHVGGKPDDSG